MEEKKLQAEPYRLAMTPSLCRGLDDAFARWGMTRREGVERLAAWFIDAPEVVQQLTLGTVPDDLRSQAVDVMRERFIAERKNESPSVLQRIAASPARQSKASFPRGKRS